MNPEGFIQRCPHDRKNPYAMISRDVIFDKRLKSSPRLVLCGLLSLPDDWKLRPSEFAKRIGLNIDTVYDALNKLIEAGYCTKKEIRNERGHRVAFDYFITEKPLENPVMNKIPKRKKPCQENSVTTINDSYISSEEKNDNEASQKVCITPETSRHRLSQKSGDAIVFDPRTYKLPCGKLLSPRMRNALLKFKGEDYVRLLANVAYAEDYIRKGGIENEEKYLQQCISQDYAGKVEQKETNRLWVTFVCMHLKIRGAGLKKSYFWLKHEDQMVTIDLDLNPGLFARVLRQKLIELRGIDPEQLLGL